MRRPARVTISKQCDIVGYVNQNCLSWVHYPRAKEVKTEMVKNLKTQSVQTQKLFNTCTTAHRAITGFENSLIIGSADIYFIPTHLMQKAVALVNLYAEVSGKLST